MAKAPKPTAKKPPSTALAVQDDGALMGADSALRDRLLDQAARGGAKWIRANVTYGATQGGRDLSKLNALIDAAKARGMHVQATLMGDPKYAQQTAGNLSYNNADPKLMAEFARTVATAEKGRINRYSVWNEPNHPSFLAGKDPALAYRRLYQAGYEALKRADPANQVLLGEVMPGSSKRARDDPRQAANFLRAVINRGDKPLNAYGVALHPYDDMSGKAPGTELTIKHLDVLNRILADAQKTGRLKTATGNKPGMFLTEFGYQRATVNDANRAAGNQQAYQRAQQAGARQMLYYQLAGTKRDPGAPGDEGVSDTVDSTGGILARGRPGSAARAPDTGWKWDTSIEDAQGNIDGPLRNVQRRPRPVVRSARSRRF